jgi:hypothetical protein
VLLGFSQTACLMVPERLGKNLIYGRRHDAGPVRNSRLTAALDLNESPD